MFLRGIDSLDDLGKRVFVDVKKWFDEVRMKVIEVFNNVVFSMFDCIVVM